MMDSEQRKHLQQLRETHKKRLRVLELKAAAKGLDTPPDWLTEMEDLRTTIAELDAQIADVEQEKASSSARGFSVELSLKIVLSIDYDKWDDDLEAAAIRAFAAVMEIPPEKVKIVKKSSGSTALITKTPLKAALRLYYLYLIGDELLQEMGVTYVGLFPIEDINIPPSEILFAPLAILVPAIILTIFYIINGQLDFSLKRNIVVAVIILIRIIFGLRIKEFTVLLLQLIITIVVFIISLMLALAIY